MRVIWDILYIYFTIYITNFNLSSYLFNYKITIKLLIQVYYKKTSSGKKF